MGPHLDKKKLPCIFCLIHLHAHTGLTMQMYFYKCFHFCSLASDHCIQLPFPQCLLHIVYSKKRFRNRISFNYNTTMKEDAITECYRLDVFTIEIV